MKSLSYIAAGMLAALLLGSCDPSQFCLNCADPDALKSSDARLDGPVVDGNGLPPDACTPSQEICDGLDNDCNGIIDDGGMPQVGETCGNATPPCSEGVWQCTNGELTCTGTLPTPEICDNVDNDCNGVTDNGNPGGGAFCGTDLGECIAGRTECQAGNLVCVGAVGEPGAVVETCDGRDNDCDGDFDENLGGSPCGVTDVGECSLGSEQCVGGQIVCVGDVEPTFEFCDALDQDCDGNPTNGFDLMGDPTNCGACGNVCDLPHAIEGCVLGACTVALCETGWWDTNPFMNGCEYQCEFESSVDVCNQRDDDCDGEVDEDATTPPPGLCATVGACAGATPTCTANGWQCNYGPNVAVDSSGVIVPESTCDAIDNDCDGEVDESHPTVGTSCVDAGIGVCQGSGTYECAADPLAPVVCNITNPGQAPSTETCNGKDDDCNNVVDDGALTGALQQWVSIGAGVQIMKYEASRPDATATNPGSMTGYACSRAGVQPWVNVQQPDAEATCAAMGARLCTESEWHRACSVVDGISYPVAEPGAGNGLIVFEAEQYESIAAGTNGTDTWAWSPTRAPAGYSGIGALMASPDIGTSISLANAAAQAPRVSYAVNFTTTGNHYVWLRMYGPSNSNDDAHVGIGTARTSAPTNTLDGSTSWNWVRSSAISVPSTGVRYINVYMQTDGVRIDQVAVTRDTTTPAGTTGAGGTWSYATNATTYQAGVCNEDAYDTNTSLAGDQDDILATGSLSQCYANWPADDIYDMSGNVREWTRERRPGANPIRGGSSNNTGGGISCDLAFTLADDEFFFPNVGFRCCR